MAGGRQRIAEGKGPVAQVAQRSNPAVRVGNDRGVVVGQSLAMGLQDHLDVGLVLRQHIGSRTEKGDVQLIGAQRLDDPGVVRRHKGLDLYCELFL